MMERKGQATSSRSPLEGEPNRPLSDLVGGHKPVLQNFARAMRKEQTPWEQKLWSQLKRGNLGGYKFRRQQIIGNYIADFYNAEKRVIIELDGSQHADSAADKIRDQTLHTLGYQVIRIWNNEIDKNPEAVLVHILETLENSPHRNAKAHFDSPSRGELAVCGNTNTTSETMDAASKLSHSTRSPHTGEPLERSERGDCKNNAEPYPPSDLVGGRP